MAQSKIRVLIVDDISDTRENIRKLLQFESNVEVIGGARTGREAIEMADQYEPDVILMDINMPDMDGIQATERIRRKHSWVQIIILSVQGDPNYMRRAMLAGARDFLTKPPTIDELISAIHRAGEMAKEEKAKSLPVVTGTLPGSGPIGSTGFVQTVNGKVLTVYSPKGGTGCTTIAVNLALELQNNHKNVIIVDGNLQFGNVAIFFNEQSKNHVGDLTVRVDELEVGTVDEVSILHEASGLKILPAPPKPELADEITGVQFGKLLGFLKRFYHYVIVDTETYLSDVTLSSIDASDLLLLITTQDIPSVASARLFLDLVSALGISGQQIKFIMNRYDRRVNITPERISASFKKEIFSVIPLDSGSTIPAINRGAPFILDEKARSQPAGRGIIELAKLVLKEYEVDKGTKK